MMIDGVSRIVTIELTFDLLRTARVWAKSKQPLALDIGAKLNRAHALEKRLRESGFP